MSKLLPKFDCGLCGNPICMVLARRILLGLQNPEDCKFIYQENLQKIQDLIPKKEEKRRHPHPNVEEDVIEINPCTEDGKVTLETQLKPRFGGIDLFGDFFDQIQLCNSLSEAEIFDKVNCSPKMGYGLVEIAGKRAHIFKTGKIIMRRADNRDDALLTLAKISKIMMPARICSCGNILVDCLGGACNTCFKEECKALLDSLEVKDVDDYGYITIGELLGNKKDKVDENLMKNFKILKDILTNVRKIFEGIREGNEIDKNNLIDKTDEESKSIYKNCTKCILEHEDKADTMIALIQYGLARDLMRARDGFFVSEGNKEKELLNDAAELLFDAYERFDKKDLEGSKVIWEKYEKFRSSRDMKLTSIGPIKIATNAFYISRILGIRVPDL